jgi:Lipase (class 3)
MNSEPQHNAPNSAAGYSAAMAADLMQIARLPEIYENALQSGGAAGANAALQNATPEHLKGNIIVLQRDNITAIIAHDPKTNTVTITFDPTLAGGNILTNPDIRDNFFRGHKPHDLGGSVHGGLYEKLTDEPNNGASLIHRIEGVLHDLASRQDTPLTVNFTGFSKGGAQAVLAAGEIMANGLFDENPNIRLGQIYAFSPPAYGDANFINAFNAKVNQLGGNAWTVEVHGDKTPTILTPEASGYFTRYDYGHGGNHAYILPETGQTLLNAPRDQIGTLRAQPAIDGAHDSNKIQTILNNQKPPAPSDTPSIEIKPPPPAITIIGI